MTELRGSGRHAAPPEAARPAPDDVEPDEVWVPPPYEPTRPGDFVEYASAGFQVRRKHRGAALLLCLLLVAGLGFGGWEFYLRDNGSGPSLPTCTQASAALPPATAHGVKIADGGHLPAGVPLPPNVPARICSVTIAQRVLVVGVWTGESESAYTALLDTGGWILSTTRGDVTVHGSLASKQVVLTLTRNGMLVAGYLH